MTSSKEVLLWKERKLNSVLVFIDRLGKDTWRKRISEFNLQLWLDIANGLLQSGTKLQLTQNAEKSSALSVRKYPWYRDGGRSEFNPRLWTLIIKAKQANMPADNIDRAIKKGAGELGGVMIEELLYEGYAPGGVGLIVEVYR